MRDDPQTYAIIGAAMEVHRELGPGFLESVYADALATEFQVRGIPYIREAPLRIFLCYDRVMVELKALRATTTRDDAQIIHYLHGTRMPIGLPLNFGTAKLDYQRFAC